MKSEHELIVVFKKSVSEEEAEKLIKSFDVAYRNGMDSSKGKIYFYATGPKYILTFKDAENKMHFQKKRHQFMTEIHQIYEPDWDIQKD
jgi:hypothetical protein